MRVVRRGGPARPIGEGVDSALRALGVPSKALSRRVRAAWDHAADPAWRGVAEPECLQQGVLVVAVSSAALRHDLAQFHAPRLLARLRVLLPDDPLVGLRFRAGSVADRLPPGAS